MKKTNILLFSKNRTLQLKSLLLSLRHFSDFDEKRVTVLYVHDDPGVDFTPIMNEFSCRFVKQTDFLADVRSIVEEFDGDYVQFMVDDLIFRDNFSYSEIENLLDQHKEIDAFSFRLGRNIKCGKQPVFTELDEWLVWETSSDLGRHWNYFWDLSDALYRKELVIRYLNKCRPHRETFPNPLEDHFYSSMPSTHTYSGIVKWVLAIKFAFAKKSHRMACYALSKCFTQGVNLVADIDDGRDEYHSPGSLHQKMIEGMVIDFTGLGSVEIIEPNPGHELFRLITTEELQQRLSGGQAD